jgi:Na+-translocating ferredoxin:NAD+ oxidoreductase RnfC subunit
MTPDDNVVPPTINSKEDLIDAIKKSGIVGLGGAGFPTYVKFSSDKPMEIEELVVKQKPVLMERVLKDSFNNSLPPDRK